MSDTDTLSERLIREIIEGCEGVTPGPWESDGIKNDGFMSYEVTDPNNRSVADALNAGVIEVQEEEGRGWDEQGRKNMAHIARLDPATVRSMATELLANRTALDAANATIERLREALTEIYASPLTPAEGEAAGWCMLVDGDKSYHIPPAELSTLMAHGMLKMLPDGSYRLCEEEEMERDPGSAGVNNPHPRALLAVLRAMLASRSTPAEGGTAQPVQVGQKWRWLGRMETEFFTPGQCYTILSVHPGTDYTSVYITDNNGAGSNGGQGHSWSFRPEAGSDNFLDHFELAASRSTPSGEKGNG